MAIDFSSYSDERLIKLVGDGIGSANGLASSMELQRRQNLKLCKTIETLDSNIKKQSNIEINLTRAIYFLTGVGILVAIIQIIF